MYERFAALLKARKITAHTVSLATGITSATFSSWKQGIYTPKLEKMEKIAEFLGVTVDYLMGRTDDPQTSSLESKYQKLQQQIIKDKQADNLHNIYTDLTEENQHMLLEFAEFLLSKQNKNRP